MLFNEIAYVVFLPVVVLLHFALPPRARWALLLAASYFFYMWWKPSYAILIFSSTAVAYVTGRLMGRGADRQTRTPWLVLSLVCNLGLLFSFKYFNFFNNSVKAALAMIRHDHLWSLSDLDVLLPVGISFYTFQTLSYSIEVYRGRQQAERHFGYFALYVSFFPQLVAGPIERPQHLLPQLRRTHRFDPAGAREALFLILWGLFKKVVIADRLASLVAPVYDSPTHFGGPMLTLATLAFAFQIYCDFSAYSDIAIGSARLLGVRLMYNFHRPYVAANVVEFWRRWHISLSTWFRDYLYIPLGGSRVAGMRMTFNILAVFLLSGLWHGAAWTFVIWGGLHAVYYLCHAVWKPWREALEARFGCTETPRWYRACAVVLTFLAVCFAWIFFRADNLGQALDVVRGLGGGWDALYTEGMFKSQLQLLDFHRKHVIWMAILAVSLLLFEWRHPDIEIETLVAQRKWWFRWPLYVVLAVSILTFGMTEEVPFVYFQF